jgi:5'-3' exonuclease
MAAIQGIPVVTPEGLEADDVLCSAAAQARAAGASTVIMTSDRDSFALIDDNTRVLRIINGGVEASPVLNAERLVTMLGVRPDQYRDFAALRGDPSDNLPGVPGVGPKTAARLLAEFGDAASIFDADTSAVVGAAMAAKLKDPLARERWLLNCQVMRMHDDLDLKNAINQKLPLVESAVRTVFTEHQLIASLGPALQVLAGCEQPTAPVRIATSQPAWAKPTKFSRIPLPVKAKVDQLALF